MKKYYLIMNPGSGSGKSKKLFQKIFSLLKEKNIEFTHQITSDLSSAFNISRNANLANFDVIIAVGGDGTINQVINGFFDAFGRRISQMKFGVIYTGTSPDFCKSYHIPYRNIEDSIRIILAEKSQKIKVGKIQLRNQNNQKITRYFVCCANFGLGATLARNANNGIRKILGDKLGTFVSLLKTLKNYKPSDFDIRIDGKNHRILKLHSLSIGLTKYIASGITVNHDLSDQNFYTLTVKNMGLRNIPKVLKKIYSGEKIFNDDVVTLEYLSEIEIMENAQNSEVEFDGDPQGFLPCSIKLTEDELDVIVE